jgi:EamA domain-containing membrane protein RarD
VAPAFRLASRGGGQSTPGAQFRASAALLCCNWFLYIWAVSADRVVDASLGYFINPLFSVLLGVLLLHERLRPCNGYRSQLPRPG